MSVNVIGIRNAVRNRMQAGMNADMFIINICVGRDGIMSYDRHRGWEHRGSPATNLQYTVCASYISLLLVIDGK